MRRNSCRQRQHWSILSGFSFSVQTYHEGTDFPCVTQIDTKITTTDTCRADPRRNHGKVIKSGSKYLLSVSGEKWTDRQKTRAKILFRMFPKIKEAYTLICSLRSVFSNKSIDRGTAKVKLHEWYQKVSACTLREVKAARDAIKYKEEEVLNYFINRSTNAHAESLNSKLKGFRAQLRGVQDLPFFMFRASIIFE